MGPIAATRGSARAGAGDGREARLNAHLYRTAWLIAAVGLVVALLTLAAPRTASEPGLPGRFDASAAFDLAGELGAIGRERAAGSAAATRSATWVQTQLRAIPGTGQRVRVQEFTARDAGGRPIRMTNVFLALPATESAGERGGLVVMAPRDTPEGVSGGTSGTAMLIQIARQQAAVIRRRPAIYVSTDGAAVGNAGSRWFLSRFSDFAISAGIVLDAPGEGRAGDIHVWHGGNGPAQAADLAATAERAVTSAGANPRLRRDLWRQLVDRTLPQTFGDQGPLIDAGVPAVALASRPDRPLGTDFEPSVERLSLAGDAALGLIAALDAGDAATDPAATFVINGRVLRPLFVRIAALFLLLPLAVLAIDAFAGARRRGASTAGALRRLARLSAPALAALAALHICVLLDLLPGPAAGGPPDPAIVDFGPAAILSGLVALAAAGGAWALVRRRPQRRAGRGLAEARWAAGMIAALALGLAIWIVNPLAIVVLLPMLHATALVPLARRPGQLLGLLALVVLLPILVVAGLAARIGINPLEGLWYAIETGASGARGLAGPALLVALVAVVSIVVLEPLRSGTLPGPRPRARSAL